MNEVPIKMVKKLRALAQIAADLRQGKSFNITRSQLWEHLHAMTSGRRGLCGDCMAFVKET